MATAMTMISLEVESVKEQLAALSVWQIVTLAFSVYYIFRCLVDIFEPKKRVPNAPVFEPSLLLQARFVAGGYKLIQDGYREFKDVPYVVRRFDCDITILPMKYFAEVGPMPEAKCSGRQVHINNLVPRWTGIEFMKDGDLHFRVVGNKLTRELYKFVDIARVELDEGWRLFAPDCEGTLDWIDFDIQDFCRVIVSRISARVFLGHSASRNEEWPKLAYGFSIDLFLTAFMLRMFPPWSHRFIVPFLPHYHRLKRHVRAAQSIIKPLIEQHEEAEKKRRLGMKIQEEDTLLNWMLDNATEDERSVSQMSNRICMLALASIHTTSMSVANMLLNVCEHPEHTPILVEEIDKVYEELGASNIGLFTIATWYLL